MPRTVQIIPEFTYPHVETYLNDNSRLYDSSDTATETALVTQAYAFISGRGIVNKWIKRSSSSDTTQTFGKSIFSKYGQPYMQAVDAAGADQTAVWMMRVAADDAAYSNCIIKIGVKADGFVEDGDNTSNKFSVKFIWDTVDDQLYSNDSVSTYMDINSSKFVVDGSRVVDDDGYELYPLMSFVAAGPGQSGDYYSIRITKADTFEREFGISMYLFEVLDSETGLVVAAQYVGTITESLRYLSDGVTLINDVLDDAAVGTVPVFINVNTETVDALYEKYKVFYGNLYESISKKAAKLKNDNTLTDSEISNGVVSPADANRQAALDEYLTLMNRIAGLSDNYTANIDEFDPIFGLLPNSSESLLGFEQATPDITKKEVDLSTSTGIKLDNGSDGDLAGMTNDDIINEANWSYGPVDSTITTYDISGTAVSKDVKVRGKVSAGSAYIDILTDLYIKAWNGTRDKKVLSKWRMPVTTFWGAGYPYEVNLQIAALNTLRQNGRAYLDMGIVDYLSSGNMLAIAAKYDSLITHDISCDIGYYLIREASTNKKVPVTTTYYMALNYAKHLLDYGVQYPYVKGRCTLSGHIKDSVRPEIDETDSRVKEFLKNHRINYFEAIGENEYERATQYTRQVIDGDAAIATDLLDEHNSAVYYALKRSLEADCNAQLLNFDDAYIRNTFVQTLKAKYSTWEGVLVESVDFSWGITQYEFNHSILHLYAAVVMRGLTEIILLEIDVNARQNNFTGQITSTEE